MRRRLIFTAWLILAAPAAGQVNNPEYADYLLVGRFGEICTMCEAIVLCQAGDREFDTNVIPEDGDFTLYHLQTRTFWSQVSTIWEWFIANFNADALAQRGHTRPVIVHTVSGGRWTAPRTVEARLSLEPARIAMPDAVIDRVERRWLKTDASADLGHCTRLPLWESLELIAQHDE